MVSGNKGSGIADAFDGSNFSADQLKVTKKDATNLSLMCICAILACLGIAVFVFMNVPWETRMPYDGKYNRSGNGIPMQIAMAPVLVPIFGIWRAVSRPDKNPRTKAGRIRGYVLAVVFLLICILVQWTMANAILVAGGYQS
ncbi:hypothetical protein [Arthrobacter sp. Leaf141]|uniref:hypothetical protein n=1 Tax=Arthrobacter sp. Leaf141 TaxID=1736273 RepID=UPI0012F9969B|nr:hypothetical protein [Arthrobacter sp. Leaf141]